MKTSNELKLRKPQFYAFDVETHICNFCASLTPTITWQAIRCMGSVLGTAAALTAFIFTLTYALDGECLHVCRSGSIVQSVQQAAECQQSDSRFRLEPTLACQVTDKN